MSITPMDGTPSWLNERFLAAALQGGEDKQPSVEIITFHIATSDTFTGFSSDIFRVRVTYKTANSAQEQSQALVIKVPETGGLVLNVVGPMICDKEFLYYTTMLPKMEEKMNVAFAPASFYSLVDKVVVMEDLGSRFVIADKHKQLDFEHCKLVVATLAKYHASTLALYDENTELIEFLGREGFFPEGGTLQRWVELGTRTLGQALSETEANKDCADFFLSRVDNIWDTLVDCLKPKPGRLNLLNHGDPWSNNLFIRYNDAKEPVEVRLIDYQVSRYSLPATDLVYFVYSSAQHDVREHRQWELYGHYLEVLNGTLEQLGRSERLTPEQLKEDLRTVTPWFIGVTLFAISLIFSGGTKDAQDFLGFTTEDYKCGNADSKIIKVLHGEVLMSRIPHMVRQFTNSIKP